MRIERDFVIEQLQRVWEKIVQAHDATNTLRDIRRAKGVDKGEAWRCGERADVALGDARYILSGVVGQMTRMPPNTEESIPGQARNVGSRVDLLASCLLSRAPDPLLQEADEFYELAVQFNIMAQTVELRGYELLRKINDPKWSRDPQRTFSPSQRAEILKTSHHRCALCRVKLGAQWHADHIIPWSKGGRTELANGQALCVPCNIRKGCSIDAAPSLGTCQNCDSDMVMNESGEAWVCLDCQRHMNFSEKSLMWVNDDEEIS